MMRIYKSDERIGIDGEKDLCLGYKRNRDYGIKLDCNVSNLIIENFRWYVSKYNNKFLRKLWGIWQVIKYF